MKKTSTAVTPVICSSSEIMTEIENLQRELSTASAQRDQAAAAQDRKEFDRLATECDQLQREIHFLGPQRAAAVDRERLEAEAEAQRRQRELDESDKHEWKQIEQQAETFDRALAEAEKAATSIRDIGARINARNPGGYSAMQAAKFSRKSVFTRAAAKSGIGEHLEIGFVLISHRESLAEIVRGARAAQVE